MARTKLAVTAVILYLVFAPSLAAAEPTEASAARACLDRDQRRAEIASGRVVKLTTAIRNSRRRVSGELIRAQLCRRGKGYVYLLTVLMRNGKVVRARVNAATGRLIGVR